MAQLKPEQLAEILGDLGPEYLLSQDWLHSLCWVINREFFRVNQIREDGKKATPHKRARKWQQIARGTRRLQEMLLGFDYDMERELARTHEHHRSMKPPTLEQPSPDPMRADMLEVSRSAPWNSPNRAAKESHRIKESLSTLAAAESGIRYDCKRKDSKRKHDRYRDLLLERLARIYMIYFNKRPAARREGKWPIFLSRVLSIVESKESSVDAAHEAWLKVNKTFFCKVN